MSNVIHVDFTGKLEVGDIIEIPGRKGWFKVTGFHDGKEGTHYEVEPVQDGSDALGG